MTNSITLSKKLQKNCPKDLLNKSFIVKHLDELTAKGADERGIIVFAENGHMYTFSEEMTRKYLEVPGKINDMIYPADMKKIYVVFVCPIDKKMAKNAKKQVFKKCGVVINPQHAEIEDFEDGFFFEVHKDHEMNVVNAIHSIDEFSCYAGEPKFDEETNTWLNAYDV